MQSTATTVKDYLASLPPDRRKAVTTLRALIRKNLPPGYRDVVQYGIGWVVPLSRYPDTNGQPLALAGIASQKHYISLYLMIVYGYPEIERWFKAEYAKSGKKLNMGNAVCASGAWTRSCWSSSRRRSRVCPWSSTSRPTSP